VRSLEHRLLAYNILISLKKVRNSLEEVNEGCCYRATWLESELVTEAEVRRRKLKGYMKSLTTIRSVIRERIGVMEMGLKSAGD